MSDSEVVGGVPKQGGSVVDSAAAATEPADLPGAAQSAAALTAGTRPDRRALTAAALLAILGAVLAWVVAGRVWSHATVGGAENALLVSATGNDLTGTVTAFALAAIAGALALFATRKTGRQLVGGLLVGAGCVIAMSAAGSRDGAHARSVLAAKASAKGVGGVVDHFGSNAYWLAAVAGGVIVAAAGLLAVVRGRTWPAMSSRYDTPAVRAAKAEAQAAAAQATTKGLWDALDRGMDPTGEAPAETSGESAGPTPTPRSEH